ncbi:MAG: glycosyltransferase family 39 protein [Maribacter sp.]|uniref:ArnT family glycosyltransferase n=1 Tax=Maribacter sp. TaxID=1897614 RepID=UPI0032978FF6
MLDSLIHKLTPNYTNLKHWTVFGILSAVSFFVRFPFFFRDYVDRDESTFILMAQSWVDGNLPYTELWDLKPPIAFLFFAVVIYLFGKSFLAIRFAGVIIVALTAFFTYRITENLSSKKVAFWAGIICVALQSMFGSIQGVMSEHICMVFLVPAVYIIILKKQWYWLGFAGVLMGMAIMVKLNMAYTVLFVGVYLIYHFVKEKKYLGGSVAIAAYGLGVIAIVVLTWLPYYLNGIQELWWKSVVIAPLDYAEASQNSIFKLVPPFVLIGAFLFFAWKQKYLDFKKTPIQLLLITLLGVLYAFFKGGRINSHYLIQLYPILLVFIVIVSSGFFTRLKLKLPKVLLLLLLLIPAESYLEYYRIVRHKIERGSFHNGEGITVPQYLLENEIDTKNILFLEYHIGYWLLNEKPPTKAATHPSNICKPEMFAAYNNPRNTAMEELQYIMEYLRPKTLVTRKDRLIFDEKQTEPNNYIDAYIESHYELLNTIDDAKIYRLLE